MAKRIVSQARGHGSSVYRVRRKAFRFKVKYPSRLSGEGTVIKLVNSPAHTSPLAKISYNNGVFYIPAFKQMVEGQKINFDGKDVNDGNILELGNIPVKTYVYNIESRPGDGGVFIRTAGSSGVVSKIVGNEVYVLMPSKKNQEQPLELLRGRGDLKNL